MNAISTRGANDVCVAFLPRMRMCPVPWKQHWILSQIARSQTQFPFAIQNLRQSSYVHPAPAHGNSRIQERSSDGREKKFIALCKRKSLNLNSNVRASTQIPFSIWFCENVKAIKLQFFRSSFFQLDIINATDSCLYVRRRSDSGNILEKIRSP